MNIFKASAFFHSWGKRLLKHVTPNRGKKLNNFLNIDLYYFACLKTRKTWKSFLENLLIKNELF